MIKTFDCIVLGVGGFGSGVLFHLAKRGLRVLGIEQFGVAHDRGSSHGETRIIRKAYFEHPDYVPLLVEAYRLWSELEQETGESLCRLCGLMLAGPADGEAIAGAKLSAAKYGVAIEELETADAGRRFPGFRFSDDASVVYEADAGFLYPEKCIEAHINRALAAGAVLKTNETVVDWDLDSGTVRVQTEQAEYETAKLIVTAGAWTSRLLADLSISLSVVRKPLFWHPVTDKHYNVENGAPAFYFELPSGVFYGFPSIDSQTVKLAEHSGGNDVADPSNVDRDVHPDDFAPVAEFLRTAMPGVQPQAVRHSVCMYTHTADGHFITDRHPRHENVVIGAGFSGHGFKFTGVLGEALADLAIDGTTKYPVEFLSINRNALR